MGRAALPARHLRPHPLQGQRFLPRPPLTRTAARPTIAVTKNSKTPSGERGVIRSRFLIRRRSATARRLTARAHERNNPAMAQIKIECGLNFGTPETSETPQGGKRSGPVWTTLRDQVRAADALAEAAFRREAEKRPVARVVERASVTRRAK